MDIFTEPDSLQGVSVLLIEDDLLLAKETEHALRRAGAEVLGPHGDKLSALRSVAASFPTCAVIDLNLGEGPSFSVAIALRDKGVPLLLVTGYGDSVVPSELADALYLQKPVDVQAIVRSTGELVHKRRRSAAEA